MNKFLGISAVLGILFLSANVKAADLQQELTTLREDVKILQRQVYYNNEKADKAVSAENTDIRDKINEYGTSLRKMEGRLDELEHSLKENNDRLDKLNRDIEIRLKILEGRQVPASLSAPAPKIQETYAAPVANGAAASVVGDSIHGKDLAPIGGELRDAGAPEQIVTDFPSGSNVINANTPDNMYKNGMQAYESGFYDEAELAFEDVIKQFPSHSLAGNAQFWLGEVYTKQGNLNKAKAAFKDGYEKYKSGNKAADSLYRLGMTMKNTQEKQKACIVFMSFNDEFPRANAGLKNKVQAEIKKLGCK